MAEALALIEGPVCTPEQVLQQLALDGEGGLSGTSRRDDPRHCAESLLAVDSSF
jgi:hypothetical protein